mmetsp:Transcript_20576/g.64782  ORF Transcript_20576/g.64782 Transcript_20576/m.64782 type:complete len:419 (+) Transcript_20576:63-1319(+)
MGGQSRLWEVVGGVDKGGILVRSGRELSSPQAASRLSTGARVLQLELVGERLRYERLEGAGPDSGWVSLRLAGKELLVQLADGAPATPAQGNGSAAPTLPSSPPPLRDDEVRVCTWNLLAPCYHRGRDGKKEIQTKLWQSRVEVQLRAVLDAADPDVLCLQELWFAPTVLKILQSLAEERGYNVTMCRRTGAKLDGVAALVRSSRLQVLASEEQEICSMGDRVALWLVLRSPRAGEGKGESFVLGTTHFTFPHGDQEEDQRLRQGIRAAQCCYSFAGKHGLDPEAAALVFAGDFNCEDAPAGDEAMATFLGDGWRSAFAESNGQEASATHRTHRQNHACADLVLLRGAARARTAALLPLEAPDTVVIPRPEVGGAQGIEVPQTLQDWSQLSDHRPLVATVALGCAGGASGVVGASVSP